MIGPDRTQLQESNISPLGYAPWERHPAERYANAFLLNSCGRDPTGRYYLPTAAVSMDRLDQLQ